MEQFESYAEAIDLDMSKFLVCLNGSKYIPEVIADYTDGAAYGVDAAPTIFVGNVHTGYYQISGSRPYAEIQTIIHYVLGTTIRDAVTLTDPNAPAPQSQPVITADDDPVLGSVDAPVTMIEFSDFQCPFCARFYSETLPLIKANFIDTGLVKMVYRDFPLQSIHPNAIPAAVASECADEQGAYWEYHDILFESVSVWGPMEISGAVEQFKAYATDLGLDTGTFSECMDTGKYVTEVTDDYADGVEYGVTGTPAFFLGSEQTGYFPISGARPYLEFQFAIEQLLEAISQ